MAKVRKKPPFDLDAPIRDQESAVLAWLKRTGRKRVRDGMARFSIPSDSAYGVSVGDLRAYAKRVGRAHDLALSLWETERYEARMLAVFLADPAQVTLRMMDAWCRDFDSWALCDTACFHLFDKTPDSAFRKVDQWAKRKGEFQKRASFALLASLAQHDKKSADAAFEACLPRIDEAASDPRNFVKKAVLWALRGIGERSPHLHTCCLALSIELAASDDSTRRWIGRGAKKELESAKIRARVAKRGA